MMCRTLPLATRGVSPLVLGLAMTCLGLGCASPTKPDSQDMRRFQAAGPIQPKFDYEKARQVKPLATEYRLVPGDLIDVYMPTVLATIRDDVMLPEDRRGVYRTRVDNQGQVPMPLIGPVELAGLTIAEAEAKLSPLYHPEYVKNPPSVVVSVSEHRQFPVRIVGAVKRPGVYRLRHDQMTVISLLNKAEGLRTDGAAALRIVPPGAKRKPDGEIEGESVLLPVRNLAIPFSDVALEPGATVEVEQFEPRKISVMGLVNKPGVFPYPPEVDYNLYQAVALAGGLNNVADPSTATIYRQDEAGELVTATFKVKGKSVGPKIKLKPGDVIIVDSNVYTSLRLVISRMVGFGFGLSLR